MAKKFLYQEIRSQIIRRIQTGEYPEGSRIPNTRELADEFCTTPITISKAIQQLVQEGIIERAPRRGSFVSPMRLWDSRRKPDVITRMVGAILFDDTLFWAKAIGGIEDALNEDGFHMVLCNDGGSFQKARQYVDDLCHKGIDGFIFAPIGCPTKEEYEARNGELIRHIESRDVPVLLFHRYVESTKCSVITADNYGDTRDMINEFLKTGIRHPVCISHYHTSVAREREQGFCDALRERGFEDPESRVFNLHPTHQRIGLENQEEIRRILLADEDIDGIFGIYLDVIDMIRRIAKNEAKLASRLFRFASYEFLDPDMSEESVDTSVIQPIYDMGNLAGQMILRKIDDWRHISMRFVVPSRLKVRSDQGIVHTPIE